MTGHALSAPSLVDRIKTTLVGLRMPRALEIVDVIVRQLERGETTALEAIDSLLMEELTLRETRRVKIALMMPSLVRCGLFGELQYLAEQQGKR